MQEFNFAGKNVGVEAAFTGQVEEELNDNCVHCSEEHR
jgi:hypothetical protein